MGKHMHYGICNEPIAPLYEEAVYCLGAAGVSSGKADEILYGWLVKIEETDIGTNSAFVMTEYGYRGYVNLSDFVIGNVADEWSKGDGLYVVDRGCLDVLCEPRVVARALKTLYRGSYVRIKKNSLPLPEGWATLILNNGEEGFAPACMLKKATLPVPVGPYKPVVRAVSSDNDNRLREALANSARRYLGTQYRWGGKTPLGIDCSGLTFMSYFENGIYIYRDAKLKDGYPVRRISKQAMDVGDLLYFPGHVAMYLGKNQYIHSTAKEGSFGVVINSLDVRMPNFRADLADKLEAVGSVFS